MLSAFSFLTLTKVRQDGVRRDRHILDICITITDYEIIMLESPGTDAAAPEGKASSDKDKACTVGKVYLPLPLRQ